MVVVPGGVCGAVRGCDRGPCGGARGGGPVVVPVVVAVVCGVRGARGAGARFRVLVALVVPVVLGPHGAVAMPVVCLWWFPLWCPWWSWSGRSPHPASTLWRGGCGVARFWCHGVVSCWPSRLNNGVRWRGHFCRLCLAVSRVVPVGLWCGGRGAVGWSYIVRAKHIVFDP